MSYEGELAALATAFCWSATSLFFHAAGKRIGAFTVNQIRIVFAVAFLLCAHFAMTGSPWPGWASSEQLLLLAVSGWVGLLLGDSFYFWSLVEVGPKLATLLMTLAPLIAAGVAWVSLGEELGPYALAGMAVTMSGVVLAIWGRRDAPDGRTRGRLARGVCFGILGAVGQGVGIVIAKKALVSIDALSGTLIRMTAAMVVLISIAGAQAVIAHRTGKPSAIARGVRDLRAVGSTAGGAFFGPFVGVWLSLHAVMHAEIGVATTLMATVPIIVIPQTWMLQKERPTLLEVVGAAGAVAGVFLLFHRG